MKTTFIASLMGICCFICSSRAQFNIVELAEQKDLVQANGYVGQLYLKRKNLNGAYLFLTDALYVAKKQQKNVDSCHYNLGVLCLLIGDPGKNKEAVSHFEAIQNSPSFKHYWENKTIAYIANRQYSMAEAAVNRTDSTQSLSWYLRGLLLLQKEFFGQATKAFQNVMRKGLQNFDPLPVAVALYQTRGDSKVKNNRQVMGKLLSDAQRYHQNKNERNLKTAVWLQAMVLAEEGKTSAAVRCLERLPAGDSLVQYATAYIYFKGGEDSLAQLKLHKLVKYHSWSEPYILLGHLAARKASIHVNDKARWLKAIGFYTKALQIKPLAPAYESRALAWFRMFDYQKQDSDSCIVNAQEDLQKVRNYAAYELAFDTEMAAVRAYHYIIYALMFKKYTSKTFKKENLAEIAVSAYVGYQNLIKRDSSKVEPYQGFASLQLLLNQYDGAIFNFQHAYQLRQHPKNWLGIGLSYYEMNDWENAGKYFAKVLNKQPSNATAVLGMGLVQWHTKKDIPEAIRQVNQAYLNRHLEKDDVTRATYIFNQARIKSNLLFTTSGYAPTALGFEAYISDSILPLYREAKAITPLADSGAYFVNLGFEAEKLGFRDLAVNWYKKSNSAAGANNLAILLAKEGRVEEAKQLLEQIEEKYSLAKKNLALLKEGKINCGCMKSAEFLYVHVGFEPGEIILKTDNKFVPFFESRVSPITEFISFKKPVISRSYDNGSHYGVGRKGTKCPEIIKKG